ncbi:MAG: nucleoside monophosphate kinase [Candidatus Aenigmatarchaeota archaeon]
MPKLLIVVVGLPASGKTFTAELIAKRYHAAFVSSGDVIRREIKRRRLPYTRDTEASVSAWFHEKNREALVAKHAWNMIRGRRNDIFVIEGLRTCSQLKTLERLAGMKAVVIETYAPLKLRVLRSARRRRFSDHNLEYIRERDRREKKRGLGRLIAHADARIDNSGTKKDLEKSIDKVMKGLLKA